MHARVARLLLLLVASFAALPLVFAAAAPEPTAFERFVTDPDTVSRGVARGRLAHERRLDGDRHRARCTKPCGPDSAQRMRGARFELSHNGGIGTASTSTNANSRSSRATSALMERGDTARWPARRGERAARGNSVDRHRELVGCRIPCSGSCARSCSACRDVDGPSAVDLRRRDLRLSATAPLPICASSSSAR